MKKNMAEIISKDEKELKTLALAKKEELFKLMMDNKQNKIKNTRSIFNTRKEIARILTVLRERELIAETNQGKIVEEAVK